MNDKGIEEPLIRKLQPLGPWTDTELAVLRSFNLRKRRFEAYQPIVQFRDATDDAFLVQRGWTCLYKLLPDGGRQVVTFPLPGDFVGLPGVGLDDSAYWFESLTDVEISPVSAPILLQGVAAEPRIARALQWTLALEHSIIIEHLINVARRSALVRTAHFILELATRLRLIGGATEHGFACPVNQYWLADALGLTAIHLNRVLRELREAHLVTVRSGHVDIHDFVGLKELAAFDADYLTPPTRRN